jgi:hypothetical protein
MSLRDLETSWDECAVKEPAAGAINVKGRWPLPIAMGILYNLLSAGHAFRAVKIEARGTLG